MSDICLVIISVLFPPLPVWIRRGLCSTDSLINILLCILGYFPGLIHSWYIIAKYPPYSHNYDSKIYYIHQNSRDLESQHHHHHHHHHSHNYNHTTISLEPLGASLPNYGSTAESGPLEGLLAHMPASAPPAYTELPK